MEKVLPILGLASAILAALAVLLLTGGAYLVFPLLALAAAVVAFLAKSRNGLIAGIVLALAGLVAIFFLVGNISFEGGGGIGDDQQEGTLGWAVALCVGLLVSAAVVWLRWDSMDPTWLRYLVVAVPIAWIIVLLTHGAIGEYFTGSNWAVAILALAAGAPSVMALRKATA